LFAGDGFELELEGEMLGMEAGQTTGRALIAYSSFERALAITRSVSRSGFVSTLAPTIELAIEAMGRTRYDVIVIAEELVDEHGMSLVERFHHDSGGASVLLGAVAADSSLGIVLEPSHWRPPSRAMRADVLEWGPLRLDAARRLAWWDGASLRLTPKQFRLLYALTRARGAVCSVEELHEAVFGDAFFGDTERISAHVRRVRCLIEDDTAHPSFLLTVRGEGFRLADRSHRVSADGVAALLSVD
jgi:DNA-binding response OmpR family regulator